jgi:gamma-butyrobetaine dioxygenase
MTSVMATSTVSTGVPAAVSAAVAGDGIAINWGSGQSFFHALWLADNCPEDGDRNKAFRTFSVVDLDPELTVTDATVTGDFLEVTFSDGDRSVFPVAWLHANRPDRRSGRPRNISTFHGDTALPEFAMPTKGSPAHCDLLDAVSAFGAAVVTGIPDGTPGTEALAALIGRIRETDFGRIFDLIVEPDTWELSQTGFALDPHTDDPFRYNPSGCSALHCISSTNSGGESIIVDGFAVAEEMRNVDPQGFELLCTIAVPYIRHRTESVHQGEDVFMMADAPIIALDRDGELAGIRFHERSMAPLDLDPETIGAYYRAFIRFTKLVNDEKFFVRRHLAPGEAIVFDNQRVLHGRTAFTGEGGGRHLQLFTVDRDQFHSRLRRLREDHGRAGVDERLTPGNLS